MTEKILAFQALTPAQTRELADQGVTVVPASDWQSATEISIIFGWSRQNGLAVLQNPANQVKWIQTVSAGIDYLPLDWIREHHILSLIHI